MSLPQKQCAVPTTCKAVSSEAAHRMFFVPFVYKTNTANGYWSVNITIILINYLVNQIVLYEANTCMIGNNKMILEEWKIWTNCVIHSNE